jgi:predicted ATPase
MKQAAIKDCWTNLPKVAKAANGILSITQNCGAQQRSFNTDGVFAVVGLNGSGKSCFFDFLINNSYNRINFHNHEVILYDKSIINLPGAILQAKLVDPSAELRESNRKLLAFHSLWGQQGHVSFNTEEISLLNFVLGSSYDDVMFEEIEASDNEVCPRFLAKINDIEIEFDSLSLGEQLVFYIYWCLTKKHKTPGIFLIEEPESGLSPVSQRRLVDLLVYVSSKRSKQIFISTHSPFIVNCLGAHRVLLMKKTNQAEWIQANQCNYLEELGMELGKKGIIFVEDNKARLFAEQLLPLYGSNLMKTRDLVFLNGESDVYEVVKRNKILSDDFKIIGLLDADQRTITKYSEHPGKFYFLPGLLPPEQEVISYVEKYVEQYADVLMINTRTLSDAIRRCRGLDHHDFFEGLSRDVYGNVRLTVYQAAFRIWFLNYPKRQEIHELMKALDPTLPQENIDEVDQNFPLRSEPPGLQVKRKGVTAFLRSLCS